MDMRKGFVGVVMVTAFVAAGFWLFGGGGRDITNYPPKDGPIIAFGDSLVYGAGSTRGNDFISLLSAKVGKPIDNMGVPGDTTAQGLARLESVIDKHPSVVIVLLGGNDYLQRRSREETFANLGTILGSLYAEGVVVVLLGVRGGVLRDNFSERFDALADEYGTAYVPDVLDGIIGEPGLMSDQIHPNDAGYARIAEKVYPVLARVLGGE